jgi:hypothetical protein
MCPRVTIHTYVAKLTRSDIGRTLKKVMAFELAITV